MNRILGALSMLIAVAFPVHAENVVKFGFCAKTITSAAAPFAVATKMGWYPPGMKVQLVPVAGSTDCVKLVATGDLPYSLPSIEPLPAAIQQGVKARIFYTAYQGNIYGIAVRRGVPSARSRISRARRSASRRWRREAFTSPAGCSR